MERERMLLKKSKQTTIKDNGFYYTSPEMVKYLLSFVPITKEDTVLDAGSGDNKVWYNNIQCNRKYECEIRDGHDFLEWDIKVDYIVGNPPFYLNWAFYEKASTIANKGIYFLNNIDGWNGLTPNRLEYFKNKGFYLNKLVIVQDRRWYGRYYFIGLQKKENNFLEWNCKSF